MFSLFPSETREANSFPYNYCDADIGSFSALA